MKLTKKQREELRMKFGGRCAYCGCELQKGWHADHITPVRRTIVEKIENGRARLTTSMDGVDPALDVVDNLFPACVQCNLLKSSSSVEGFRRNIASQVEKATDYSNHFRTALRFDQVKITQSPIVFWFEKYQREGAA